MTTSSTPEATFEQITDLRQAIMADLDNGQWAGEIARARKVTLSLALVLYMKPEQVILCRTCVGSGWVGRTEADAFTAECCRSCRGLGYTSEVRI